ncbi:MAG: serine hydrolase domain-containing protein [Pseudomonadota bacterium]
MRSIILVLLALAWLAAHTAAAAPVNLEQVESRIDQLMQREEMVGLAVAIVEDGEITFAKGFGETVHGSGDPVTESTVFRWASLSKGVAGTLAGLYAADGTLSLDAPVSTYRTNLRLPGGAHTRATLTDVLSHQLGIVPNAYDTRLEDGRDPANIRRALGGLRATCTVGSCHTYQNVAFDTITEVIIRQTGDAYETAAETRLFEPLGMTTASASRAGLLTHAYAQPHRRLRRSRTPRLVTVKEPYFRVPAAGGVNSSVIDLARYMRAQMGLRPDVLPAPVLDTIHTPQIRTLREQRYMNRRYGARLTGAEYGLGWRTYDYAGNRVIGHRGAVEGYRATILFDPVRDTGIAVLWNSFASNPVGLQFEVMDMVYGLPTEDWMRIDGDLS